MLIDLDDCEVNGTTAGTQDLCIGFLERVVLSDGEERYRLRALPPRTNLSHEPKLRGWCGSTNNVAVWAEGLGRVVGRKDDRVSVRRIGAGTEDERAALVALGWGALS